MNGRLILMNGQYRDAEIDINFQADPLGDSLAQYYIIADSEKMRTLKLKGVVASISVKRNFYLQAEEITRLDLTIQEIADGLKIMVSPSFGLQFPDIQLSVNVAELDSYTSKTANYGFMSTMILMTSFFVMLN